MIIIVGMFSVYSIQKETFPKAEFDVIVINTAYPGSSSEDVEKLVSISIERSLKGVDGIKKLNSLSTEGSSIVYIEVEPDYIVDDVLDDIKQAVDTIDDLPEDAKTPRFISANNKNRATIKIPLTGASHEELREVSKRLRDKIEEYSKVARVDFEGYRVDEVRVLIDPKKLNAFDLTISEVSNAIKEKNLNLSAGKLENESGDIFIRTVSEFETIDDIKSVIVRSNDSGCQVKVLDVAQVIRQPIKGSVIQRSQGEPAIYLDVKIKEKADVISTTNKVKVITEKFFENKKYEHIKYSYVDDLSYYVKRRLDVLKENGLFGLALVFICLLFFLNFSTSVITSLGAPLAFMVAFAGMTYFGVSLNLISMFGLILVLGMLVDDSIIVAEHYYQKLEEGIGPREAALQAAMETIQPVTATVLTTMVAFGALFFMGGIMGKFLWPVPAVVIICLAASLFECFFILPSHLAEFSRMRPKHTGKRWYDPLLKFYKKVLKKSVEWPITVLLTFFIVFGATVFTASTMKFELFPGDDVRVALVQIKGKVGTPLHLTDEAMKKLEKIAVEELDSKTELDSMRSEVGVLTSEHGKKSGGQYGSIVLYLFPPDMRERSTNQLVTAITNRAKREIPNYVVSSKLLSGGPPKGKPVEINLSGPNLNDLITVSKIVEKKLASIDGVLTSEIDFEEGKKQYAVTIDDVEARRLGLSVTKVAFELRRALAGDVLTEIRENDEDIEIKVLLNDKARENLNALNSISLLNSQGRRIPLNKIVKFTPQDGAFVIRRQDRKRIISVSGTLDKAKTTPLQISKDLKEPISEILKEFPEVFFEFGGENKDTEESMSGLFKAFGIALMCIFLILVVMFGSLGQPIIVMSAIPLGMIGVVIAFKLKAIPLGFMAMMGVVGLVGVVVNDSIVLVNFINIKRQTVSDLRQAVYEACIARFRPVILTTFTTVAGLMPVAESAGGDPFIRPMAISFAYGLLCATAVTLVFIPCSYIIYVKGLRYSSRMYSKALGIVRREKSVTTGAEL